MTICDSSFVSGSVAAHTRPESSDFKRKLYSPVAGATTKPSSIIPAGGGH